MVLFLLNRLVGRQVLITGLVVGRGRGRRMSIGMGTSGVARLLLLDRGRFERGVARKGIGNERRSCSRAVLTKRSLCRLCALLRTVVSGGSRLRSSSPGLLTGGCLSLSSLCLVIRSAHCLQIELSQLLLLFCFDNND